MSARSVRAALAAVVVLLALAAAAFVRVDRSQWDLRVYLECSRTLAAGADPYATDPVVDASRFQCLYPPLVTDLYRPFGAADALGGRAGERLWAALKVLALALLLWMWRRWMLRPGADLTRLLAVVLLYGDPFWSDFVSGNAGSFEHVVLWAGVAAFVAGKDLWFAAAIAVAAQPKLMPVLLLPLALFAPRPAWGAAAAGAALAAGLFGLNELAHPGLTKVFFAHLADPLQAWHYERGPNNCSAYALVHHAVETATGVRWIATLWATRVHLAFAALVAVLSARALLAVRRGPGSDAEKRRAAALLACAGYALVVPRLKDYSFLVLIPPTIAVLESDVPAAMKLSIVVCAALNSAKGLAEKAGLGPWALFAGYFKLYAAVLVWVCLAFLDNTVENRRSKG
ncbi:MAG: DUF2029 domain-containing protein [Elusimicrobia bacterium]|nr:DUF2029 domain-containing protein [Elusimicrobiota bacterium]